MISAKLVEKAELVEYKTCTKCNTSHPKTSFYRQSKAKDGYNTWCKVCIARGMRDLARSRKKAAIELLGGKCSSCGGIFHQSAYDFHHKNPTEKEGGIARMLQSFSINHPKVRQELEKCILVCSNCHRTIHSEDNL